MGKLINYLGSKNHYAAYLAIFRVFLCFHIVKKIYVNWGSLSILLENAANERSYYFEKFPMLFINIANIPLFILIIYALCVLWLLGIGKNITILALSVMYLFFASVFAELANGGDNLLYFILFYMVFTDSYQYFSLTKSNGKYNNVVSNLSSLSIMIHLCLVYFVSAFHKIHADEWFNGVATYYIWNIDRFKSPFNDWFSRNSFIIAATTYVTLWFEVFFPVLVWFKQTRALLLIVGIALHLGIYFTMMIYDFEILFIALYGFWVSNSFWEKIIFKASTKFNLKWVY